MSGGKACKPAQGLSGDTPFHDAASVVLRRRLGAVADAVERLKRSRQSDGVQPGDIHQVRVSVRRASAAISVFESSIGGAKRLGKVRRRLREMRRAIGTTRACDVGLSILEHDRGAAEPDHGREIEMLESVLRRRRDRSMRNVRRAIRRCSPDRLRRWGRKLAAATVEVGVEGEASRPATLGEAARSTLSVLLTDIRCCGAKDLQQAEALHELRLSAKRLRYATEVFGPCFEPEQLDRAAELLVHMQDQLGIANDLHEMLALICERAAKGTHSGEFRSLLGGYQVRFEQARGEFVAWWRGAGERELVAAYSGFIAEAAGGSLPVLIVGQTWSRPRIASITPGVHGSEA